MKIVALAGGPDGEHSVAFAAEPEEVVGRHRRAVADDVENEAEAEAGRLISVTARKGVEDSPRFTLAHAEPARCSAACLTSEDRRTVERVMGTIYFSSGTCG